MKYYVVRLKCGVRAMRLGYSIEDVKTRNPDVDTVEDPVNF